METDKCEDGHLSKCRSVSGGGRIETGNQRTESGWKRCFAWISIIILAGMISVYTLLLLTMREQGGERYAEMGLLLDYLRRQAAFVTPLNAALALGVFLVSFIALCSVYLGKTKWLEWLIRYRWPVSLALFVCCVLLKVNNTSLQMWQNLLGNGNQNLQPMWGVPRAIRSDEWGTWSVFLFSQDAAGYPAVNSLMSGGAGVDSTWISVGGIPAWNLAAVFKPLYWGFLLLGLERGYSFLFAARILLLFNISYEMALRYTKGQRGWSLAAAMMLTCSPYVQWWFSQSIAEVLIFGQGILLCLHQYTQKPQTLPRVGWAVLLAYAIGCYVMIGYVSWLISCGYLLIACGIYMGWRNRMKLTRKDFPVIGIPLGVILGILGVIIWQSRDTLMAVRNSVYPGERIITGGNFSPSLYSDAYSLLLPIVRPAMVNSCEAASLITFAPLGLILQLRSAIIRRKMPAPDVILLAVEMLFLLFAGIGFPAWLAKATLLSQVNRPELVLGIADTVLLIRALSQKETVSWSIAIPLAAILAVIRMLITRAEYEMDHLEMLFLTGVYGMCYLSFLWMSRKERRERRQTMCVLAAVAILGGGFINPLQPNISDIRNTEIIRTIQNLDGEKEGTWLVEAEGWALLSDIPLLAGRRTLSTQPYPVPELWQRIDPEGKYLQKYNRFCHLHVKIDPEGEVLLSNSSRDVLEATLNMQALDDLGISWLMSDIDHTEDAFLRRYQKAGECGNYFFYSRRKEN